MRVDLDQVAPGVLAIDGLERLALEQGPDVGALLPAHLGDPPRQTLDIRIDEAEMEDTGLPVAEVVLDGLRLGDDELKQLDPDAVGGREVGHVALLEPLSEDALEDAPDLRAVVLHVQRADDVPAAERLRVPARGRCDVGDGHADMRHGNQMIGHGASLSV